MIGLFIPSYLYWKNWNVWYFSRCQTPHFTEDEVKAAFISAYNQLVTGKKEIVANAEITRKALCVTDALQEEKHKQEEIQV